MPSNLAAHRTSPSEASSSSPVAASYITPPSSPEAGGGKQVDNTTPPPRPRRNGRVPVPAFVPSPPLEASVWLRGQIEGARGAVARTAMALQRAPNTMPEHGKLKPLSVPALSAQGLATRLSVLVGAQGSYVFAPAHVCGAYGKVHYAKRLDGQGGPLVIKAVRQFDKAGVSRLNGGAKTFGASFDEIGREFIVHQDLRRKFLLFGPRLHQALLPGGTATLRRFVPREMSSEVKELVNDATHRSKAGKLEPKTYIVSTCELGDAAMLHRALWRPRGEAEGRGLRRLVARSLAYQAFVELHVLHGAVGEAHFDIKLANMHVNAGGAFRLADFGFALPVDQHGRVEACGPRGSAAAPEMYCFEDHDRPENGLGRLHRHADIWAVWMAALQLLVPLGTEVPFHRMRFVRELGCVTEVDDSCLEELTDFLVALEDKVPREGKAPRLARLASGAGVWPATGNAVVDGFFGAAAAADPRLVELALEHGLLFAPRARSDVYTQARLAGVLLQRTPQPAVELWHELLENLSREPYRQHVYAQLARYTEVVRRAPPLVSLFRLAPPPPPNGSVRRGPRVVDAAPLLGAALGRPLAPLSTAGTG